MAFTYTKMTDSTYYVSTKLKDLRNWSNSYDVNLFFFFFLTTKIERFFGSI